MKRHTLSMLSAFLMVLTIAIPVNSAEAAAAAESPEVVEVKVNSEPAGFQAEIYAGTCYIPFYAGVMALRPDAEITWEDGTFYAKAWDFTMTARPGDKYLVINGRYLYVPMGIKNWPDGAALVPVRTLATALGAHCGAPPCVLLSG